MRTGAPKALSPRGLPLLRGRTGRGLRRSGVSQPWWSSPPHGDAIGTRLYLVLGTEFVLEAGEPGREGPRVVVIVGGQAQERGRPVFRGRSHLGVGAGTVEAAAFGSGQDGSDVRVGLGRGPCRGGRGGLGGVHGTGGSLHSVRSLWVRGAAAAPPSFRGGRAGECGAAPLVSRRRARRLAGFSLPGRPQRSMGSGGEDEGLQTAGNPAGVDGQVGPHAQAQVEGGVGQDGEVAPLQGEGLDEQ